MKKQWRYTPGGGYWTSDNDGLEPRWVSAAEERQEQIEALEKADNLAANEKSKIILDKEAPSDKMEMLQGDPGDELKKS